jgi:hypothetical protein
MLVGVLERLLADDVKEMAKRIEIGGSPGR